ncbi:family 10 glycosylhydrolase [candidate division TA06 bacterium]|uniref:Family 10 glycosylhydrolase n=1 Tax=candidate division TA06 bacterium TaxID=2250710 RepID=A0A933IBB2_UNCT6|nr:family 10 glycosylhydrolase [candidate division TA06 bacterium]
MWVVRYSLTTPASVKKIVRSAHQAGINHLFVQFFAKGEAHYNSRTLPTAACVSRDFDPLALMLKECKAYGIKMHAWINVYFIWSSDQTPRDRRHVYFRNKSWFAADSEGRSLKDYGQRELTNKNLEGIFLSPANAEVKQYLRELVREILFKYDVDGIHLDYVRYGNLNYSYDLSSRNAFYSQYKVDPMALFTGDPALKPYWDTWYLWRMYNISDLVSQLKMDIIKFNPWVKLSAAVKPDPDEARLDFGQDWPSWLLNRWVDFVVLMDYSQDTPTVLRLARKSIRYQGAGRVYVGLGAWRDSMEGIMEKTRELRRAGINDIVLFSYDGLAQRGISFEELKDRGF